MKWMEFIKVQMTRPILATELLSFIEGCSQCHGLLEAKAFQHASVDDCSLCLRWDTDKPEPQGSSIGVYLSTSLKQYGLVDHSVWIEQEERGRKRATRQQKGIRGKTVLIPMSISWSTQTERIAR